MAGGTQEDDLERFLRIGMMLVDESILPAVLARPPFFYLAIRFGPCTLALSVFLPIASVRFDLPFAPCRIVFSLLVVRLLTLLKAIAVLLGPFSIIVSTLFGCHALIVDLRVCKSQSCDWLRQTLDPARRPERVKCTTRAYLTPVSLYAASVRVNLPSTREMVLRAHSSESK